MQEVNLYTNHILIPRYSICLFFPFKFRKLKLLCFICIMFQSGLYSIKYAIFRELRSKYIVGCDAILIVVYTRIVMYQLSI